MIGEAPLSIVPLLGKNELSDLKLRRADLALTHFKEFSVAIHFIVEVLDVSPQHPQIIPLLERCLADADQEVAVSFQENRIVAKLPRVTLSSTLVEGTFPKYQEVFHPDIF